jgi:hypothetical protein
MFKVRTPEGVPYTLDLAELVTNAAGGDAESERDLLLKLVGRLIAMHGHTAQARILREPLAILDLTLEP